MKLTEWKYEDKVMTSNITYISSNKYQNKYPKIYEIIDKMNIEKNENCRYYKWLAQSIKMSSI